MTYKVYIVTDSTSIWTAIQQWCFTHQSAIIEANILKDGDVNPIAILKQNPNKDEE